MATPFGPTAATGYERRRTFKQTRNGQIMWGQRIEDFEVGDTLGEGGFGRVYRARCLLTGENVALKMIDKKVIVDKGMVGRVRQEVTIHSRLKHPSILELYTYFEDEHYVYLVLELAQNRDIARYFRYEPRGMSENIAADILKQVVDGVLYLHSHNIIHRDLSLNNLLLTKDLKVKIADFGLATQLNKPDEKHLTMCGTPNYISPEVASRTQHGLPADIWGLGCLLYTLLVGKPPFDTHHVKQTLNRVIQADYKMPCGISVEAQDLLDRLLRKNPAERISLADIIKHPFLNRRFDSNIQQSTVLSRDSGFNTTSHTTQSTQLQRTLSHRMKTSSASCDVLLRRHESMDRLVMHETKPASYNNILSEVRQEDSCSYSSDEKNYRKNEYLGTNKSSSLLENMFSKKNVMSDAGDAYKNNECNIFDSAKLCNENKENLLTGNRSIGIPPLCTARLPEITHRTRNAELNITQDGSTLIKFIKKRGRHREDKVTEVCIISKDGMQIIVYSVNNGKGCPLDSLPSHTPLPNEIFSYHNLPQKHWKKYLYAARFIEIIKAKTPKVTLYNAQGKCHLMENGTDFMGEFCNGMKITISSDGLKLVDKDGNVYRNVNSFNETARETYENFEKSMKLCLEVESTLHNLSDECFPFIMGKRIASSNIGTNNLSPKVTPITSNGSINIGSFRHSAGYGEVNQDHYASNSSLNQVKTFSPLGEPFRCLNSQMNTLAVNTNYPSDRRKYDVPFSNYK